MKDTKTAPQLALLAAAVAMVGSTSCSSPNQLLQQPGVGEQEISSQRQRVEQAVYSPRDVQADIEILIEAVETIHPGLHRYRSSDEVAQAADRLRRQLREGANPISLVRAVSEFLAFVGCGHTFINPFEQPTSIQDVLLGNDDKLPLTLSVIGGELVVHSTVGDASGIASGSSIQAINGISRDELLRQLRALTPADGLRAEARDAVLTVEGYGFVPEAFDILQPLIVSPDDGTYRIRFSLPDERRVRTIRVSAISWPKRAELLAQTDPTLAAGPEDLWSWSMLDEETAYLKVGTFSTYGFSQSYTDKLASAFDLFTEQKAERLIVDLRGNSGGRDQAANALASYILDEPCIPPLFSERARYRVFPDSLRTFARSWNDTYLEQSGGTKPAEGFAFTVPYQPKTIEPAKRRFDGDVAILIDGRNASGAFYFSNAIRHCTDHTFIGDETGGSLSGVNGGTIVKLALPATGLVVDLPVRGLFDDEALAGRGVMPDVTVRNTPGDIANSFDRVRFTAQNLR